MSQLRDKLEEIGYHTSALGQYLVVYLHGDSVCSLLRDEFTGEVRLGNFYAPEDVKHIVKVYGRF